jgi:hypothetical protein
MHPKLQASQVADSQVCGHGPNTRGAAAGAATFETFDDVYALTASQAAS